VKNLFSKITVTLNSTTKNTILKLSFSKIAILKPTTMRCGAILKPSVPKNAFLKRDSETTITNPSFSFPFSNFHRLEIFSNAILDSPKSLTGSVSGYIKGYFSVVLS
jgi:hypothetical protein